jgi:flagellar hook-associated protein 1 FlgK
MAFGSLEIGRKALIAQRFGLEVTSNNIANVNTEGYSRREARFSEAAPNYRYGQFNGQGVLIDKLRSFREEFFDREIRNTGSRQSSLEQDDLVLERIEAIISEPNDVNLNDAITEFFNQFDDLALKPESIGLREHVVEIARSVVDQFNYISETLNDTRNEIGADIQSNVNIANNLISQISDLNSSSSAGQSLVANEALSLIDERERLLEDLSKLGDISVTNNDDGTVNVYMNGINLVTKGVGTELALKEEISDSGEVNLKLFKINSAGETTASLNPTYGELSSQLNHYNVTLDGADTNGGFSVMTNLNDYISAFVNNVNTITQNGFGLDDTGPVSASRNFFELSGENSLTMSISEEIDGNPRDIPLAGSPESPGDSTIARQISRLSQDSNFIGNESYTEFYAAFIGKLGAVRQNVVGNLNNLELVSEQLDNQRQSMIGVNMDEEAVNIVRYQRAFDAASRIIQTQSEMLQTIINLGR